MDDQLPHPVKVERMERLVEVVQRRATRARPALRRPHAGGAGRRHQPHRPDPAARAHPPQQGGQLRGHRRARRAGRGRDRQRHLADAERGLGEAAAQPRFFERSSRSSGPPGSARPGSRSRWPSCCASGARTRSRSPATRCRSTRGSRCSPGPRRPRSRRGSSTGCSASCRSPSDFIVGDYMPLAHAEIDAALAAGRTPIVVGGTGLYLRAALAELSLVKAPPESRGLRALVAARPATRRRSSASTWTGRGSTSGSTPGPRRSSPAGAEEEVRRAEALGPGAHRPQGARLRRAARRRPRGDEEALAQLRPPPAHLDAQDPQPARRSTAPAARRERRGRPTRDRSTDARPQ